MQLHERHDASDFEFRTQDSCSRRVKAGLDTPVGPVGRSRGAVVASGWGAVAGAADDPVLVQAIAELQAYFAGDLTVFEVPIRVEPGGLQGAVMDAMLAIPFGETRTWRLGAACPHRPSGRPVAAIRS